MERHNKVPGFLALFFGSRVGGVLHRGVHAGDQRLVPDKVLSKEMAADKAKGRRGGEDDDQNPYEHRRKAVAEGKGIYLRSARTATGKT